MKPYSIFVMAMITILGVGCAGEEETTESPSETSSETIEAKAPVDMSEPASLTEGFSTPESVLYDPEQDVYFVSNINGTPLDVDDNGYISRIGAAERSMTERWVDGAAESVELNAPKGMTILGDELWVSDIDHLRRFDRHTGAPLGSVAIEGAAFLNDLTSDGAVVYVSDSGVDKQFQPIGAAQVYMVSPDGEVEKLATESKGLGAPNGVALIDGEIWVVSLSSNELYRLEDGHKADVVMLPTGGLDGFVPLSDGTVLISSWEGKAVYRGPLSGEFTPIVENVTSPADIGVDSKRNLLLIPVFQENRIQIQPLENAGSDETEPPAS